MQSIIKIFRSIVTDRGISLAAAWSFNQLAYAIIYPFVPIYLSDERGLPYAMVSLLFPLLGLASIVAPVPCGWLTDRFGHQIMMLAGQLLRGVIFFFLAFCVYIKAPFWVFVAALMFNTAIGVAFQVGSDAYLVEIAALEERPGYYSKIRIGYNVGWALGPMCGAFFANTPFWLFFIVTGLLCVFGTFYTFFSCCSKKNLFCRPGGEGRKKNVQGSIWTEIFHRRFICLMLGMLLLMLLASQLYSTLSIYSTKVVGISRKAMGSIYSLNGTMVLLLQIPLVALLKRLKTPLTVQLLMGALLYCGGYFQLGFAGGAAAIAIAVVVVTLGEIIFQPALYAAASGSANSGNAGRMMSVSSLMRGVGYSVGPWIGGQLFGRVSSFTLWAVLSGFAALSALMFLCAHEKKTDTEKML